MIQASAWDFVVFCAGLVVTGIGGLITTLRWFLSAVEQRQEAQWTRLRERLDTIEAGHREEAQQWRRVERELLELKADLPRLYVRREDYIRGQSLLEAKMDTLAVKIENLLLKGVESDKRANDARPA